MVTKAEQRRKAKGVPWFSDNTWKQWLMFLVLIAIPIAAAYKPVIDLQESIRNVINVYEGTKLPKPEWAPSFLVVQILAVYLYVTMGFASYLVWKIGNGFNSETCPGLFLYVAQLPISLLLPYVFLQLGLVNAAGYISAALVGIQFSIFVCFFSQSKFAAFLWIPHLLLAVGQTYLMYFITNEWDTEVDAEEWAGNVARHGGTQTDYDHGDRDEL